MPRKKEVPPSTLATVTLVCPYCMENLSVPFENLVSDYSSQDCGLCGSHGDITINLFCPLCKHNVVLKNSSW